MKASGAHWLASVRREAAHFGVFYRQSRPTFRVGLAALCVGFAAGLLGPAYELLVLTPNDVFNFHLWRVVTCQLVEPNALLFAWSVASLYQLCVYVEPAWGALEVVKYVGALQLLSTLLVAALAFVAFVFFQSVELFYHAHVCGVQVGCIGALVALKQYLPDTVVLTTRWGRLKNAHLPASALAAALACWLLGLVRGTAPLQILVGLQASWTYLRYLQALPGAEHVGDDSEHFTWASLFPRRVQPLAGAVGRATFRALERVRVCQRLRHDVLDAPYTLMEGLESVETVPLESRDAERRRQRALRVLNDRLTTVAGGGGLPAGATLASSSSSPAISTQLLQGEQEEESGVARDVLGGAALARTGAVGE